jgi:hypothetical protein
VNDWGKPTEIVDLTGVRHVRFGEVLPDLDLTKLATDDLHALRCALECEEQRRNEYWKDAEWLDKRQAEYDRRMRAYGAERLGKTSFEMWATHWEVVWELDALPYEQGGKQ